MDVDDDSDVEVLTPRRFPVRSNGVLGQNPDGGAAKSGDLNINNANDPHSDEIEVTASTTTNANIEYPHMRHQCGLHPFSMTSTGDNEKCCAKCYCYVCDVPANECMSWTKEHEGGGDGDGDANNNGGDGGGHCHAHDKDDAWVELKSRAKASKSQGGAGKASAPPPGGSSPIATTSAVRNPYQGARNGDGRGRMHARVTSLVHNDFLNRLLVPGAAMDGMMDTGDERGAAQHQRTRERKDMRIPEVLAENFQKAVSLQERSSAESDDVPAAAEGDKKSSGASGQAVGVAKENAPPQTAAVAAANDSSARVRRGKTEGDIASIGLGSFYVGGVKIGWPFPEVMKPQRLMAVHLIKALKDRNHVVLESPTGTGKSAAILCTVLAWQRHHMKAEREKLRGRSSGGEGDGERVEKVKIIYCSRTHSQVAQMVASLKGTPYRPRMSILGSRERMCIHRSIKPRDPGAEPVNGVNVNNECRLRVRNTEKQRKHLHSNPGSRHGPYDDDDPPEYMPGDGEDAGGVRDGTAADDGADDGGGGEDANGQYLSRQRTCPHYRQLTASRVANLAHSAFVPGKQVDCCSVGGKKSKYGAHDIEDLVNFGVDPYLRKDVALYRRDGEESFGLSLKSWGGGSSVQAVKPNTPASMNGCVKAGDKILRVNGSDVSRSDPATVVSKIKATRSDPLILDVSRDGSLSSGGNGGYSPRAACPYYVSQILSKDADIIFAPYNYVLDPGIRDALGIDLAGAVVVLDEAHNVESTLREAGSGKFGEFELCELIVMLNEFAMTEKSTSNMIEIGGGTNAETQYLCDVAHTLLLAVEKVVEKLRTAKVCFEKNPGKKGAANVLRDWERFHTPDDTEFEVLFDGPTGDKNMRCVGCQPFFDKLGVTITDLETLMRYVEAFQNHFRGRENDALADRDKLSNLVDRLIDLITKLHAAAQTPEHYYAAVVATANGNLEFASGGDAADDGESRRGRFKKKPRALPLIAPRTLANPDRPANPCSHSLCRAKCTDAFNPIRHGDKSCDGSTPKWECHLNLSLLTPGPLMQQLSNESRTVVLASGSLSPISSLCAELNLFSANGPLSPARAAQPSNPTATLPKVQRRLQSQPMPLEADHVVDLDKQLFACSIGHFPDGSELRVTQANYKHDEFLEKLGDSIVRIVEGIPYGGVLVFVPSYSLLRKCVNSWNPNAYRSSNRRWWASQNDEAGNSVWDRLEDLKHRVIVEPTGDQDAFEEAKQDYMNSIQQHGGCVLFAVFRGKMSEGISFNDNNARGVICVGLPLPSAFALDIRVKMDYNDEQRKLRNRTDLLPGREWYNQQAYRAIAQALGRCIRHAADYGAIFLLDSRHCDDGSPNDGIPRAHKNLPKWMRHHVKNVTRQSPGKGSIFRYASSNSSDSIHGWSGLKTDLKLFFRAAKPYTNGVLKRLNEKMAAARRKDAGLGTMKERSTLSVAASAGASVDSTPTAISSPKQSDTSAVSSSAKPAASNSVNSIYKPPRTGTIQEMFKKQQEAGGSQKSQVSTSCSSKSSKKTNPSSLISMFEKQRAVAASPKTVPAQDVMDEDEEPPSAKDLDADLPSAKSGTESSNKYTPDNNTFAFKRSPFATDMLTPTTQVAVDTSRLALSQRQGVLASASQVASQSQAFPASTEGDEERLCVVCEDGKKNTLLLPCKHMCLCEKCAHECLHKTLKNCPLCRTPIDSSMPVFW